MIRTEDLRTRTPRSVGKRLSLLRRGIGHIVAAHAQLIPSSVDWYSAACAGVNALPTRISTEPEV